MDPLEAYLHEKDPLADYLKSKAEPDSPELNAIGPASFLNKDKFKPSPAHRKFNNTGPIEQVRSDIEASKEATKPITTGGAFGAPAASALDRLTGGGYTAAFNIDKAIADNPIARAVDASPLGPYIGKRGGAIADQNLQDMERYRAYHPTLSATTDIPGYLEGAPRAIARTVEEGLAKHAIGPMQRAIGGSALTSGALAATEAAGRGESLPGIARDTGEGAVGGTAIAAPLTVGSSLLGKAASNVLNSKGGKARQFLEERGVKVSPRSPGSGSRIDSMVTQGTTDADIGQQAEVSAKRGLDMLKEEKGAILGGLGRRYGKIANTPEAQQLHDASDIVAKMQSAVDDLDISPQAEQSLRSAIDKVTKQQGAQFNAEVDPYLLSETDLNKLKRRLDRAGRSGLSTDEATHPVRQAANQTREIVDQGPFAEANADYSRASKHYQQSRKLLGINERPKTPDESQAAVNKVKNLITRRGQNTVTAGGQSDRLDQFAERHPDIGLEFERPEILRKRADIGFHLFPQHGGLIDRTEAPIASIAAHALLGGMTGILPALAYTNRNAINARLLYGPAQGSQAAARLMLGMSPQLAGPGRELIEERR